jgi:molybdopterin-containing oxidoreductase family membrane subunit
MWLERWLIIIPVLTHPRLVPYTIYFPTPTEIALTVASAALLAAMTLVFFKFFPAISIWEIAEGRAKAGGIQEPEEMPRAKPASAFRSAMRRRLGP